MLVSVVVVLVAFVVVKILQQIWSHRPLPNLPEPPQSSFFLGHVGALLKVYTPHPLLNDTSIAQQFHLALEHLHQQTDLAPVFQLRSAYRRIVVVNKWQAVEHLYKQRTRASQYLFRRLKQPIFHIFGSGLFSADGEQWKRLRTLTAPHFKSISVNKMLPRVCGHVDALISKWQASPAHRQRIDIDAEAGSLTSNIMMDVSFGWHGEKGQESQSTDYLGIFGRIIEMGLSEKHAGNLAKYLPLKLRQWLGFPRVVQFFKDRAVLTGLMKAMVVKHREKDQATEASFLSAMLDARTNEPNSKHHLSDEEMMGQLFQVLLAGTDTTAHSIAWSIHYLLEHSEWQTKLRTEIQDCFGKHGLHGTDVSHEDLRRLVLLDAFLNETLRLSPVAPALGFDPSRDAQMPSELLPEVRRGVIVIANIRTMMRDPDAFSDPLAFRPERWFPAADRPADIVKHDPKMFLAFGAGPRVCPGQHLARLELKVSLAKMLSVFEFQYAKGVSGADVSEKMAMFLKPVGLFAKAVLINKNSEE